MQKMEGVSYSVPLEYFSDQGRISPDKLKMDFPDDDKQSYGSQDDRISEVPFRPEEQIEGNPFQQLVAHCLEVQGFAGNADEAILLAKEKINSLPFSTLRFLVQLRNMIDHKTIPAPKADPFAFLQLDHLFQAAELASTAGYLEIAHLLYKKVGIKDKDKGLTEKHGLAFFRLAEQCEKGLGTIAAPALARAFCQKAIDAKYHPALFRMGQYHELGVGGQKNFTEAVIQYRRGAEENEGQCLLRLARYYREEVEQIDQNTKLALEYLERARQSGCDLPLFEKGLIAYHATETKERGFNEIKLAAEQGSYSAQLWLANCKSIAESLDPGPYYDASLDNHPMALFRHLGMINYEGKSVARHIGLACAFFAKVVESPDCTNLDWRNFIKAKMAHDKNSPLEEQIPSFDGLIYLYLLYKEGYQDDVQTIPVNWEKALRAFDRAKSIDVDKKLEKQGVFQNLLEEVRDIKAKWERLISLHEQVQKGQKVLSNLEAQLTNLVNLVPIQDLLLKEKAIREVRSLYASLLKELKSVKESNRDFNEDMASIYAQKSDEVESLLARTIEEFNKRADHRCDPTKEYIKEVKSLESPFNFDESKNEQGFAHLTRTLASILVMKAQDPNDLIPDLVIIQKELIENMKIKGREILLAFEKQIAQLRLCNHKKNEVASKKVSISEILHARLPALGEYQVQLDAIVEGLDKELESVVLDSQSQDLNTELQRVMSKLDQIQAQFETKKRALFSRKEKIEGIEAKKSAVFARLRGKQAAIASEIQEYQAGNAANLESIERECASITIDQGSEDLDLEIERVTESLTALEDRFEHALHAFSLLSQQKSSLEARSREQDEIRELRAKNQEFERRVKEAENRVHQAERIAAQATKQAARQAEQQRKGHQEELERQKLTNESLRREIENLRLIVQSIPVTTSIEILQNRISQRVNELREKGVKAYKEYNLNNFPPRVYNLEGLETILFGIGFKRQGDANGSHRHYERQAESVGLSPHGSEEADKAQIQQVLNFLLADLNKAI